LLQAFKQEKNGMTSLLQDLRFVGQKRRKQLSASALVLLALLLGIGAQSRGVAALSYLHPSRYNLLGNAEAERLSLALLGLFAAVALGLALVGIYGVMTYSVPARTHEIGCCLARGAQTSEVLKLVLWQGLKLALLGIGIGLAAALLLARWIEVLLFGVAATDPLLFAGVTIFLGVIAFFVSYLPARQATKIDPMIALRYE
jgi:ABC-type antimicrobial peptide transport system permease subunit